MPVDIQKIFNEELPAKLSAHPEAAKQIGATFQIVITGENGGEWFIDTSSAGPSVERGSKAADCTISLMADDFQTLYENPQANAVPLFFQGKLKVQGNQMLAMKLQKIFTLG
jgi:putative sterol carrier protein